MHTGAPTLSQLQLWDAEQWQGPILVTASSHGCPRETATPRVAKCLGDNPTWPLPQSRATAMAAAVAQQGPWPGAASSKGLHLPPLLQPNPVTTSMSAPHLHPTSSTLTSMPIPPPPHTPVSILVPSPCLLAAPSSCTPLSISSMGSPDPTTSTSIPHCGCTNFPHTSHSCPGGLSSRIPPLLVLPPCSQTSPRHSPPTQQDAARTDSQSWAVPQCKTRTKGHRALYPSDTSPGMDTGLVSRVFNRNRRRWGRAPYKSWLQESGIA